MPEHIEISVTAPDGSRIAHGKFPLPVKIGRGGGEPVQVKLPENNASISRFHAQLSIENGRLMVEDRSSNGTVHAGQRLNKGQKAVLADVDSFDIVGFRIAVHRQQPAAPPAPKPAAPARPLPNIETLFDATILDRANRIVERVPIGPLTAICIRRGNSLRFEAVPTEPDAEALLARYRQDGKDPVYAITVFGHGAQLVLGSPQAAAVLSLNRITSPAQQRDLRPLDVIEIEGTRVELLIAGKKAIRCVNARCGLLNEHFPDVTCRWCGFRLTEGTTRLVTRR